MCHRLRRHGFCEYGCTRTQEMCHRYFRGQCSYGQFCRYKHPNDLEEAHEILGLHPQGRNVTYELVMFAFRQHSGLNGAEFEKVTNAKDLLVQQRYPPPPNPDVEEAHVLLGLDPQGTYVTHELVKAAYQKRTLYTHPDKNPGLGPGPFQMLKNATDVLLQKYPEQRTGRHM